MNSEDIKLVTELIEKKDSDQLKEVIKDLHPADIAELCNELDAEDARFIYLLLDNETAADVLIEMDEDARKKFLEILPPETIAKRFVDYMDSDDAVDIIREMDEDKQEEVLSHRTGRRHRRLAEIRRRYCRWFDGYGNGDCERELEYARMPARNATTGRRNGRDILCICGRRR